MKKGEKGMRVEVEIERERNEQELSSLEVYEFLVVRQDTPLAEWFVPPS